VTSTGSGNRARQSARPSGSACQALPDQVAEVFWPGGGDQQRAGRPQDAPQLGAISRREDVQHQVGDLLSDRQPAPRVAPDGADPRMRTGRGVHGVLRDVQRQAGVSRQPRKDVGQVCGDRRVMPETEELAAGAHHRGRVAGPCGSSRLEQAEIALPCDIEAVTPGLTSARSCRARPGGGRSACRR
jgi:hypothetical protein